MPAWINHPEWGYFVGEFLGLGFYESHIKAGDCSPEERPIEFKNIEEAQRYLDLWANGACGSYVTIVPPLVKGGQDVNPRTRR